MNRSQYVSYQCQECGFQNEWRRDEIIQRGEDKVYRGQYVYYEYTLPCRNTQLRCNGRYVVDVPRWEE